MRHPEEPVVASEPMIFRDVVTNAGGAFDTDTGIFHAPVNGLYEFNFTIRKISGTGQFVFDIMASWRQICRVGIDSYSDDQDDSVSCSTVAELQTGDTVYVESDEDVSNLANNPTTFSGHLIQSYV